MMSLNKVEKTLSSVGIALRDSKDSFRPLEDVIADVAEKWNTLSEVQKAQISNAIAGQRQAQIFTSLMQNWGDVTKYVTAETESLSLAEKNYGIYLENIEAKQNELRASWEKLVSGAATKEFIMSFIEGATAILDFVDAIGGIPTVLKIVIPLAIAFNAELIKTKILASGDVLKGLLLGLQSLIPAFSGATVAAEGTSASITAANVAALPFVATIGLLTAGLIYGIKVINDYKKAQDDILSTLKDNSEEIKSSASSYEEYVKKTKEAAEAQGYFVENGKVFHEGYRGAKVYVEGMDLLSESMWNAINSVDEGDRKLEEFNRDMLDGGDYAQGASVSYQSLAEKIKEISDSSSQLSDLMNKSETGSLGFEDIEKLAQVYPDYLQALSVEGDQLRLNTDMVREYLYEKANQAVIDAENAGATENEISILRAYADQLRENQYVLLDGVQVTQGAFNEMAWSIAQNAAMSGNSFTDLQGKALTSAEAIYSFMTSGDSAFNNFVQQAANLTGRSVQDIMNQINGMLSTTYNNAVSMINAVGGMVGGLSPDERDEVKVSVGGYAPIFTPAPANYQYPGGLSDYSQSLGGGSSGDSNSTNSNLEHQRELEKEIEDARKNAIEDLKDQLDVYKDIIDARKEIINTLADERQYQQDIDNKNKEILKVQNELATLQFDTSEEANARRLELQDELANLTQDLENIQYDQSVEVQTRALDDEYKSLEGKINLAIKQIEGIQAGSLSEFTSQLSGVLNSLSSQIPQYHDGGVVGNGMTLKSNEIFAKLMNGEVVSTPSQIESFMSKTLPQIAEGSSNFTGGNIELSMPINVAGTLDKSVIPDLDKFAEKLLVRLQQMMNQKGWNRRADLFQT